jgi:predicted nucleic acid-binding protein
VSALLIDASALLAVLLGEPSRDALIQVTSRRELACAPTLRWEVGNALIAGFRRKRLTTEVVLEAWNRFERVRVRAVEVDVHKALEIAMDLGLYAYDGYVLEAARSERLPILTLDAGMMRAAKRLGLKWIEVKE